MNNRKCYFLFTSLMLVMVIAQHNMLYAQQILVGRDSLPAGTLDTLIISRLYSSPFRYLDSNNTPMSHFVRVGQYYDTTSFQYLVGEATIINGSFSDILPFDHPMMKRYHTPLVAVYNYNMQTYDNPIYTVRFKLQPGDTLMYFRDFRFELAMKDSGNVKLPQTDTSVFHISDTLRFVVTLVNDSSDVVLDTLDNIMVYPNKSMTETYADVVSQLMRDSLYTQYGCYKRYPAKTDWTSDSVRVVISPIFYPQLTNNYANRAILANYFWSRSFMDWAIQSFALGLMLGDSLNALPKRAVRPANNEYMILTLTPSVVSIASRNVKVRNTGSSETIERIVIYNTAGKKVATRQIHFDGEEVTLGDLSVGQYIVVAYGKKEMSWSLMLVAY